MKVVVIRTSDFMGKKPPCKGAKLEKVPLIDWRNLPSLEEVRKESWGERWLAMGRDHREENGMIRRTLDNKEWTIEIDDIWKFVRQVGKDCIIEHTNDYEGIEWEIEIYDTYRE